MSQLPLAHGHKSGLEYHRMLLDDAARTSTYDRALRRLVRPGDVVLDLGSGSGILAMLAARQGAAKVYAVESMPVAGLASELIAANGLQDRIEVIQADILGHEIPEPVDLLVSDCMGRFLVDDAMLPALQAGCRWLKPEGRCCPARIELMLAPVADLYLRAVDLFDERLFGLDLSPGHKYALNSGYHARLMSQALLCPAQLYRSVVPRELEGLDDVWAGFDTELQFVCRRGGRLQGIAGWFRAELGPSVWLSTEPGIETHWGQYLLPLEPRSVQTGDVINLRLWLEQSATDLVWHWTGSRERNGVKLASFEHESEQRLGERS